MLGSEEANLKSHGWPERCGVIVDITADQFSDKTETVIVTDDPTWHRSFMDRKRSTATFDCRYRGEYENAYAAILEMLDR